MAGTTFKDDRSWTMVKILFASGNFLKVELPIKPRVKGIHILEKGKRRGKRWRVGEEGELPEDCQ